MKSNRNWPAIVAIILAIIGWDYFMLKPARDAAFEKSKQVQQAALNDKKANKTKTSQSALSSSTHEAPVKQVSAPGEPRSLEEIYQRENISYKEYPLHDERFLRIYEDGAIGHVRFDDYKVQGTEDKAVVIASNGFRWISDNKKLENCFQSLKNTDSSFLKFKAENNSAACGLEYSFNENKTINVVLSVKAKVNMVGSLSFASIDSIKDPDAKGVGGYYADYETRHVAYKLDDEIEHMRGDDLAEKSLVRGVIDWFSWGDKYFLSLFLPQGNYNPDVFHQSFSRNQEQDLDKAFFGLRYPIESSVEMVDYKLNAFFGSTRSEELNAVKPGMDEVLYLGFFASVARIMLWALKQLYTVFHNYGVAIILLTLLVRLAFWPLNRKVFESGQKMKDIQPKMEAIKKKYGNDKTQAAQMQAEIMALYRSEKVNPLGSCLPLLLQMPIFIGLYGALGNSVELYQAPFFGWLQDLSLPDPYYILPAAWTLSLFITMKFTPQPQSQPGMPNMKWMMIAMYAFFGYMAKDWPSGLNLYLFVSNIVGIVQQAAFRNKSKNLTPIQEGA